MELNLCRKLALGLASLQNHKSKCLLFKPPGLRRFVTAAPAIYDKHGQSQRKEKCK